MSFFLLLFICFFYHSYIIYSDLHSPPTANGWQCCASCDGGTLLKRRRSIRIVRDHCLVGSRNSTFGQLFKRYNLFLGKNNTTFLQHAFQYLAFAGGKDISYIKLKSLMLHFEPIFFHVDFLKAVHQKINSHTQGGTLFHWDDFITLQKRDLRSKY